MNPDPGIIAGIEIGISIVLLVLCGLMSAVQRAIGDVNRNHIKAMAEEGNSKAQKIVVLSEKSFRILATTIAMIGFSAFLVGQMIITNHLSLIYGFFNSHNFPVAKAIAILITALLCSIVFLVFGVFCQDKLRDNMQREWLLHWQDMLTL